MNLEEGTFKHELRVDFLHSQEIQDHVVSQVKGGIQLIRLPAHHVFANTWRHFLVDHKNDETSGIDPSTSSTSTHLNEFSRRQPP